MSDLEQAEILCSECKHAIPKEADHCPDCGHIPAQKRKRTSGSAVFALMMAVVAVIIAASTIPYISSEVRKPIAPATGLSTEEWLEKGPRYYADELGIKIVLVIIAIPCLITLIFGHVALHYIGSNYYLIGKGYAVAGLLLAYPILLAILLAFLALSFT